MTYVYVVSYRRHEDIEPIITVFDNESSALKMANSLRDEGNYAWIDVCPLYHTFTK